MSSSWQNHLWPQGRGSESPECTPRVPCIGSWSKFSRNQFLLFEQISTASCAALARLNADKVVYKSWSHVFMGLIMTYVYTTYTCHFSVSPWQPTPLMWVGPGVQPPACLPLICHRNMLNIGCLKSLKLFKALCLCSVLLVWLSYLHSSFLFWSVAFGRVYF